MVDDLGIILRRLHKSFMTCDANCGPWLDTIETTISLDPLKGLNLAAYTSEEWKGGESICSRVLFNERRPEGKLQENLTEVLWQ